MNRRTSDRIAYLSTALVLALMVGAFFILGTNRAEAAPPTEADSACANQWQHPRSYRAQQCRSMGWFVGPGYVVTPNHVPRYIFLPVCRDEDGDTRTCEVNVTGRFGDGCGKAYLYLHRVGRGGGKPYFLYLFKWVDSGGGWHLEPIVRHNKTCAR